MAAVKAIVILDLNNQEVALLLQNSLERVINSSIRLAEDAEASTDPDTQSLGEINSTYWTALKPLTVKIWAAMQEAARKELMLAR